MIAMDAQKLYINKEAPSILICPNCGKTKAVDPSGLVNRRGRTWIAACPCGARFRVFLESRKSYRREKTRRGQFAKLPQGNVWHSMLLNSVSLFGLGFRSASAERLHVGDNVRVRFPLDDSGRHQMEGDLQVVWAKEKDVGCRFTEDMEDEKFRAFYLMI
jgi:hypothetical protein